ncbi:LITAF-like zinc ribbon domain-containing protein [Parasitella parasitica]|nr:LITAF-like zinc ribbon domain-containing protein [Parasitella parasitica]
MNRFPSSTVATFVQFVKKTKLATLKKKAQKTTSNQHKMSSTAKQPDETSEAQETGGGVEQQQQHQQQQQDPTTEPAEIDPDLSADAHRRFAEARSTPILFSSCSIRSSTSTSSSSLENSARNKNQQQRTDDNRSLCSALSITAAQQQQAEYLSRRSSQNSTQNQTFHFGTPLPLQKQQPYQYHASAGYYGAESNTPPWQTPTTTATTTPQPLPSATAPFLHRKKDMFLQANGNQRQSMSGASIQSAISTGRQTVRSWSQKRLNILKQQELPDFETQAFCEGCEKYIHTRLRYRNGPMVWLVSFILLLCTVVLFWVPFYVKYFKDVAHFCPGCGRCLGVSHQL